jgi:hypothetical protein
MRFLFITSSLEPGIDGVGDYSCVLAENLMRDGHDCAILALHDWHMPNGVTVLENSGETTARSLRLCRGMSWMQRRSHASRFIGNFAPDWIGIQFVPHGWHPRGLSMRAVYEMARLVKGFNNFVMLHELAEGLHVGAPIKRRIMGLLQRYLVTSRLLNTVAPRHIFTSNQAYLGIIRSWGFRCELLPLPSNIRRVDQADSEWFWDRLRAAGASYARSELLLVGTFASIDKKTIPDSLIHDLIGYAQQHGKQLIMLSAGRMSPAGEQFLAALAQRFSGLALWVALGKLDPVRVSSYLQQLDLGIANTPLAVIGKSGSAAAMLEHGVPVVTAKPAENFRFVTSVDDDTHGPFQYQPRVFVDRLASVLQRRTAPPVANAATTAILLAYL